MPRGDFKDPISETKEQGSSGVVISDNPSELKQINEALKDSEERFRSIVNQSGISITEHELSGRFLFANREFEKITGYTGEHLSAMRMHDLIHPNHALQYNQLLTQLAKTGEPFEAELCYLRADGSQFWVLNQSSPLLDIKHQPASVISTLRLLNRQTSSEKTWLQEEKNLAIIESITDAFFAVNASWEITYANKKAAQISNRTADEILGRVLWDEFPNLHETSYGKLYMQVAEQQQPASIVALSLADKQWYEVKAFPAKDGIVVYFKNVTDKVETEQALRKSEEHYRTLFNTIDEGFCILEILFDEKKKPVDYRILDHNYLFEEMTGLKNAMGKTALELIKNPESFWIEIYGKVALTGESVRLEDYSKNLHRWFNVYASRIGEPDEHQIAVVFNNITQRKMVERDRERFIALGSDLQAIAGPDEKFIWVSKAWERVLGYTVKELTTMSWRNFVHPEDLEQTEVTARRNLAGEEIISWENRYMHKDGSYRWFSWNSKPFVDENCTYGVAIDITERKLAEEALRESEERYSAIIHQATAGVAEMDLTGRHLFVNKKFCEMTGFSEEELYELECFDFVHPYDKEHCRTLFEQTVETGRPFISEKRIICKDKTEIWINETISSISDARNKTKSIVSVCIDISDRKNIEKQKDEFIGVASHELKTPVTSLRAYAQVLQLKFNRAGDEQSAGMMQKMEGQINRLTNLIQDLLDVTRLEGNLMAFRPEVFNFKDMVMNTIEEVQRTVMSHTILCNAIPDIYVNADLERTSQVLVNLLTNAAKYSPKASQIVVWVSTADSYITCSVEDYGIGIPSESHKYIFDRFYRVSDGSRSTYPGLGLGLYISSEIIKKQGGNIWFKSSVNEGSVFSFRLPLYKRP